MAIRFRAPTFQAIDASGDPLPGATLSFYVTQTSTPIDSFTTSALTVANANPITADAGGYFSDIWFASGGVKAILKTAAGVTVQTWDPIDTTAATENQVRSITATDTLITGDNTKLIAVNAAGGIVTLNLLASSIAGNGFVFSVKKDSSDNPLLIVPAGAETFWDGSSIVRIGPNESAKFRNTGAAWMLESGGPSVEPGSEKVWPSATPPTGWLIENAQAVSRTVYARLFAAIGTTYGVGDASTTFNLPDWRGYTPVGSDTMGTTAANRTQVSTTISTTSGSPTATVASATGVGLGQIVFSINVPGGTTISAISGTTLTLSANATATASGVAARFSMINDPQLVGSVGGEKAHIQALGEIGAHTHTLVDAHVSTFGTQAGGSNIPEFGDNNNTGSTGSSLPMNVMQPSQVRYWVIKT